MKMPAEFGFAEGDDANLILSDMLNLMLGPKAARFLERFRGPQAIVQIYTALAGSASAFSSACAETPPCRRCAG